MLKLFQLQFQKVVLCQRTFCNLKKDSFKEKLILNQEKTKQTNKTVGWPKDMLTGFRVLEKKFPRLWEIQAVPKSDAAVLRFYIFTSINATHLQKNYFEA